MTTTERDVATKIRDLRAEREQLDAEQEADPVRAAEDLASWHARDEQRRRRILEIEQSIRDYETFGSVVDTHGEALREYLRVARTIERRHAEVIKTRSYMRNHDYDNPGEGAQRHVESWWKALGAFARALPQEGGSHTAQSRVILVREAERWFRFRDSWVIAMVNVAGYGWVPSPEIGDGGELPAWLRWGAHRIPIDETAARRPDL